MSTFSIFQIAGSAMTAQSQRMNVAASNLANAPARMEYQPDHPLADDQGYVEMPNVDVVAETVNMISASRSYQANVEVVNTAKAIMSRTLSIGQ